MWGEVGQSIQDDSILFYHCLKDAGNKKIKQKEIKRKENKIKEYWS